MRCNSLDWLAVLDAEPSLGAEFDRRWAVMDDQSKTVGERFREMDELANEIIGSAA